MKKNGFVYKNSLSIVFTIIFLITIVGQALTGWKEYNQEREQDHYPPVELTTYLGSGHFMQATFENWESEFLQMYLFVVLTVFLRQVGSSESKKINGEEEVDREPNPRRKNAPAAVKRGGWVLAFYRYSLSYVLLLLFLISFYFHFLGSYRDNNEELTRKGLPTDTVLQYFGEPRFWFESFQNYQSEFLSIVAIVLLSIYLRHQGSPQSKPVDAPHMETGE
jgi:hypothetical protein